MTLRMQREVTRFVDAAIEYCGHLEREVHDPDKWLEDVLHSLSDLYASAHGLPLTHFNSDLYNEEQYDITVDDSRNMMVKLGNILKDHTWYWIYFDPTNPPDSKDDPEMGNIADDLSDIYRDIKPGLKAWDENNDSLLPEVIFGWKCPLFGTHWGVHAVSAMRALHHLCYLRGLESEKE